MAKRSPRTSGTAKSAPARATKAKPRSSSKTPPHAKAVRKAAIATPAKAAAPERVAKSAASKAPNKTAARKAPNTPAKPALARKVATAKPNGRPAPKAEKAAAPARTSTAAKTAKAPAKRPAKTASKAPVKAPLEALAKPSSKRKAAKSQAPRAEKTKSRKPRYLAAELGQPVDHDGEPVGAGSAKARSDGDLQKYALQLWRQMQSGRVVNRYTRAIERAGLTADEVWTAGLAEMRTTSSTADEIRRYRQKVLFRANLLEAIFTETIADLRRLDSIEPSDAPAAAAAETS